ncbi:MAG: oligosaccharide flippase family protein [Bacteroidales bacterium]|nr:oligosaccharide flippase family protein [Bacteroidales bacterium]
MTENSTNSNSRIAKNTIALYIRQIVTMLVSLYTVNIILAELGEVDYGIYSAVGGIVAMFSFITGTMASASQRFLAYWMSKNDSEHLRNTFSLIMLSYILLAVVTIVVSESVAVWFLNNKMNIPAERMTAANWVLQFAIAMFVIQVFAAPYMSVMIARESMTVYAYVSIADAVLKLAVVFVLQIANFDKMILLAALSTFCSLLITLFYRSYCRKRFPESHYRYYYNKADFVELMSFSLWNIIGSIANVLRGHGINILLNLFFNPVVNAARAIAYSVSTALASFYTNFYSAVKPQVFKLYAAGDNAAMNNLIFKSSKLAYFLVLVLVLPIFFYTDFFLGLWLSNPPMQTSLFVKTILISTLVETLSMPLVTGLQAANKIKLMQCVISVIYLLVLPISYVLLKFDFPAVTPMVVNVVLIFVCIVPRLLICRKYIAIKISDYTRKVLMPIFTITLLCAFVAITVCQFIPDNGDIIFIIIAMTTMTLASCAAIYVIGLTSDERQYIRSAIASKIQKK